MVMSPQNRKFRAVSMPSPPYLVKQLNSKLRFHDTHSRGFLACPTGKIDVTFSASGVVAWSDCGITRQDQALLGQHDLLQ